MSGLLKDDLTVALDDVDRTASRIVTIYDDLSAIAIDLELSRRLREGAEQRRRALVAFNHARRTAGQTPEVGDPERAHLQFLWLALKSAVSGKSSAQALQVSLAELDAELQRVIDAARNLHPEPPLPSALNALAAQVEPAQ
jgi:hypothetical protein